MITLEVIALSPYAHERLARHARRRSGRRFRDHLGRSIEIGEWQPEDWDGLLAMYRSFDPAQRTLGLPPLGEERQTVWVNELLGRGPNVVARTASGVVGHAALVAYDGGASYELAVFVHPDYQGAGVGGALVGTVLGLARRRGAERVWLTVERENRRAAALYRRLGFRPARGDAAATVAGAQPAAEVWALALSPESGATSDRWARAIAGIGSAGRVRLRALVGAVRFAWIPFVCAVVVALSSEEPRGKALALALAVASLALGVAAHGRELVLGRPERRAREEPPMSTGEWMARLR